MGFLPSCANLRHRGIECNLLCPRCGEEADEDIHIFFKCPWARGVWLLSSLGLQIDGVCAESIIEWLVRLQSELKEEQLGIACYILWELWNDRNRLVHESGGKSPAVLVQFACDSFLDFASFSKRNLINLKGV